jgi:multiple sugar transport system permease protein
MERTKLETMTVVPNTYSFTPTAKRKIKVSTITTYVLLAIGAIITAYPFFIMILNSFKNGMEIIHYPTAWPKIWTLDGYRTVFQQLNIVRLFRNSFIVSGSTTALNILFDTVAAYALAKINFKGRELLFKLVLASMMIPGIILLIPTYSMMYHIGWVDTYKALIIPGAVSSYNIFLIRQFIKNIPDAFLEAARLDGCGELRMLWNIILPMSKPAVTAVGILTFMGSWNDLFNPLLYLHNPKLFTVQLGLIQFQTQIPGVHAEQLWAATALITIPLVIVFCIFQRNFISAFTNVGLK